MAKDTQSRKWQVTINNPIEKGYTHDQLKEILKKFKSCIYWCMSDEKGNKEETYHTHLYICCSNGVLFSTMKKRFEGAHFEMCKGTSSENRDYVFKIGKWLNTSKEETRIEGTQEEWGECPLERQGARNDLQDLYDMIKQGMSDYQIMEEMPEIIFNLDKLERCRQTVIQEKSKNEWRDLEVSYIWGDTGSGKTRSVMDKYGYSNVFRITDYAHPFDNYRGQDVVVFEEFRTSVKISEMLNYLDGYPLELPCRYNNKYACYTKVYIITNIGLGQQYPNIQCDEYETFRALLRRIHNVYHFTNGTIEKSTIQITADGFRPVLDGEYVPFLENKKYNI